MQQWRPSAATKDKQTKDSSMLWHLSVLHSFLWPNNDSLFGYTTFCLSADKTFGLFSLFGYYEFMLILKLVYKYLSESLFSVLWGYILRSRIAGSYGNSLFNVLGSATFILHSH